MKKILSITLICIMLLATNVTASTPQTVEHSFWPTMDKTATVTNVHDYIISDEYVFGSDFTVDTNSEIIFNFPVGLIIYYQNEEIFSTYNETRSDMITVDFETVSYSYEQEDGYGNRYTVDKTYAASGAKLRFNVPGEYGAKIYYGFSSVEEEAAMYSGDSNEWQWSPEMNFNVIEGNESSDISVPVEEAEKPVHAFYGYYPNELSAEDDVDYFSITNVLPVLADEPFVSWIDAEKCIAPAIITAENELSGFGVSTMVDAGTTYIEGAYLSADGHTEPFESGTTIKKGETFTINDIGVYYVWATKDGINETIEATIEIDKVKANYTNSKVLVNGVETQFEAYNINNNNYFKLRDIAKVVSGTEKQFDVKWDAAYNSVDLISGMPYTSVGGELIAGNGMQKEAFKGSDNIFKDGEYAYPKAYLINNNNYFKLRDLGEMFNFDISWDGANNCVIIDTTKSYTED